MKKKIIFITGASSGLGESLAKYFARAGYNLLLVDKNKLLLEELSTKLSSETGQQIRPLVCNLANTQELENLIEKVKSELLSLDVLINNAAIHGPIGPLLKNDLGLWNEVIQINLLAPVALCKAFFPLISQTKGLIINLSGGGATAPRENFSAYATAKAGLVRFSETLAHEAKPYGVRVNSIAPGAMKTALLSEVVEKGAKIAGQSEYDLAKKVIKEGGADMNQVAELINFLISDKGLKITGKLISSIWDNWGNWSEHIEDLSENDVYTLRRIVGRDRGFDWGDI